MTTNNIRSCVVHNQIFLTIFSSHKHVYTAYVELQNAETQTSHLELEMHIEECWAISSEQYTRYKQEASLGKYCAVLDELECLVVMHLFELSRMSLPGTGCLSPHILLIIHLLTMSCRV